MHQNERVMESCGGSVISFVAEECPVRGCLAHSDGEGTNINLETKFTFLTKIQLTIVMLMQDRI